VPDSLPNQPNYQSRVAWTPRRKVHTFGDGYRQLSPDGLSPILERWDVTFSNLLLEPANTLEAFLRAHIVDRLYWIPEYDAAKYTPSVGRNLPAANYQTPKLWVVESFAKEPVSRRRFTITAVFSQEPL